MHRWLLLIALAAAVPATAEVQQKSADGFTLVERAIIPLPHGKAWHRLIQPQDWWSGEHSYSGDARHFSLEPAAGGCWCEKWEGGSVEHGRVLAIEPGKLLRLNAPLGPLQKLPVTAILNFDMTHADKGTEVVVTYRVSGPASLNLDAMADAVDAVLVDQARRLAAMDAPAQRRPLGMSHLHLPLRSVIAR